MGVTTRPLDAEFEAFVVAASPQLLAFAFRLTGDHQHAEDLLQSCLWRVVRRWSAARNNPVGYARRVMANLAKDGWRRRGRRLVEVTTDDPGAYVGSHPPVDAVALEDRDLLLSALRTLPAKVQTVLVLRYWEDLSVEETAALLGYAPGTVKSTAARGLRSLRSVLEPRGALR
jgi:RNA polymerase sigma-70 factor (sigma-E family)